MSDDVRAMWSEEELDTALATLRSDVDVDIERLALARAGLMSAAADAAPVVEPEPTTEPVVRRWVVWTATAAAVVLVAAIILVAQQVRSRESQPPASPGELLERAAANTSDEPAGPGQYRYIAQHGWGLFSVSTGDREMVSASRGETSLKAWVPPDEREDWMLRSTPCANTTRLPDGEPLDPREQEGCNPEPFEDVAPCGAFGYAADPESACTRMGTWDTPNRLFLDSLPRDPDALRDRLHADFEEHLRALRGSTPPPGYADPEAWVMLFVRGLLTSGLAPADVRAAVYRMLAELPGIEVTDRDVSLDGRGGVAFGIVVDGVREELVIEPATGEFIGNRSIYLRTKELVPAGTTFYTSVSTAVVDELGQLPR